mmetsp:Transcript_29197/g.99311  ORF Transcript_29197/g.99311 Transcript_29197/m.99311 type:complete len:201 (+) Transcript_29197:1021-1623(+)
MTTAGSAPVGSTGTTTCFTVSGRWLSPFKSTQVGDSQTLAASCLTSSLWSVAEKKQTWSRLSRAPGAAPWGSLRKMFRHVSVSSVSMKRSASSSTKKRQLLSQSTTPRLTKSQIFSGVPVTMSTSPLRSAVSAAFVLTPPMSSAQFRDGPVTCFAYASKHWCVCSARSRAGSSTMADTPRPPFFDFFDVSKAPAVALGAA